MIRDGAGDRNRRWMLRFPDFWLSPGMERIGSSVQGKPGGRYIVPTSCYDTNPWDGCSAKEDYRHFAYWENRTPWDYNDIYYDHEPQGDTIQENQ